MLRYRKQVGCNLRRNRGTVIGCNSGDTINIRPFSACKGIDKTVINKRILSFLSVGLWIFVFSFCAFAQQEELFDKQIEASGANELFDYLDEEQIEMLSSLGIDKIDFDSVFSTSPRKIIDLFYQIVSGEYRSALEAGLRAAVMIIAVAVASQFFSGDDRVQKAAFTVAALCISLSIVIPMSTCLARVMSAIELSANFMLALIPVLATVLTVSGNPTAALSYNSLCFVAAQVVTGLSSEFIKPVIQITLSLSVVTGLNESVSFEKIVSFIKKTVILLMSMTSTLFITMLTLKGMLATSADTVAVRGLRFLIGNLIPVIGGAVSDAYTSISGTLLLVKNTAAVFGIAALGVTVLPVIAECFCWIFAVNALAMLSDMLSQDRISSLLRSVSSATVLLTVSLLFIFVVFVLSIGLVMLMKGSS